MITIVRFILKSILRITQRFLGFITAMLMGPGLLLFLYLFEPHRPLPQLIVDLPSEPVEAAIVMQGRVDRILLENASTKDIEAYLRETGFKVDSAANNAVYLRRQFNCIESYSIVWTETRDRLQKAAALFEKRCPGFT
jgi:hypothetical protein